MSVSNVETLRPTDHVVDTAERIRDEYVPEWEAERKILNRPPTLAENFAEDLAKEVLRLRDVHAGLNIVSVGGAAFPVKPTDDLKLKLWDAINAYVAACKGDSSNATISVDRMCAVRGVEKVIAEIRK